MVKCDRSCGETKHNMVNSATKTVREWVSDEEIVGHSVFSYSEVCSALPHYSKQVISIELSRLVRSGIITLVHRGFYVTIPTRYKKTGIVPPHYYIDALQRHLGKPYYMSLLSAAAMHGAAHQRPQVDFVSTTLPRTSTSKDLNPHIRWVYRSPVPDEFICVRNDDSGVIRYSSPELTAPELVQYEHLVGGLGAVATVLSELVECIDFSKEQISRIFSVVKDRTVQRTGYLLDEVLGESKQADALHEAARKQMPRMKWTLLSSRSNERERGESARWKIKVTAEVEPARSSVVYAGHAGEGKEIQPRAEAALYLGGRTAAVQDKGGDKLQ